MLLADQWRARALPSAPCGRLGMCALHGQVREEQSHERSTVGLAWSDVIALWCFTVTLDP